MRITCACVREQECDLMEYLCAISISNVVNSVANLNSATPKQERKSSEWVRHRAKNDERYGHIILYVLGCGSGVGPRPWWWLMANRNRAVQCPRITHTMSRWYLCVCVGNAQRSQLISRFIPALPHTPSLYYFCQLNSERPIIVKMPICGCCTRPEIKFK